MRCRMGCAGVTGMAGSSASAACSIASCTLLSGTRALVSTTLCLCVLAMVVAFMLGLWAKEVDNAEIFKMISPAFSTLIGGMIGFLSGIKLMQNEDDKK